MFDTLMKKRENYRGSEQSDPKELLTYRHKVDSLLNTGKTDGGAEQKRAYNPFLVNNGGLLNPYINYQSLLNNPNTPSRTKSYISEATGLGRENGEQSGDYSQDLGYAGGVKNFSGADESSLAKMDVANELPKLSGGQIAKLIDTHFKNSPVISAADADGIAKAQNETGMSALAILGIGALESGWGTSNIAKRTNNIWGYGATNKNPLGNAHRYGQMSEGAGQFAREFMKTYYNKYGAKSIYSAGTGNNPAKKGYAYFDNGGINSGWASDVGSIMNEMFKTLGYSGYSKEERAGRKAADGGILANAKKYIGTPYVWGGEDMNEGGMDCSGFVYRALKDSGYNVDRTTAQGFRSYGNRVNKADMQPGDLVFYGKGGRAGHIGIYIGNGQVIQSSGGSKNTKSNPGKGVCIKNVDYRSDFLEARRI